MSLRGRYRRGDATPWGSRRFFGRSGAEWVPPVRMQGEESALLYGFKPDSQVFMAMAPATYLELCFTAWRGWGRAEVEEYTRPVVRQRFLDGEVVDAAFMDVDPATMAPWAQEGAHRAREAQRLGMPSIPVIVYARSRRTGYEFATPEFRRELRQWGTVVA